ncbi:MAG: hypothetical protein AAGC81_17040 [Pseudomonadota bacterium]
MSRAFFRLLRRLVGIVAVLVIVSGVSLAAVYYGGVRLPIVSDVTKVPYQNWTQTRELAADLTYQSSFVRQDGRLFITVDLAMPETIQRMRDFLDGGRRQIVDCGQIDLFLHGLQSADLIVEKPTIRATGNVDLELVGLINARDDWPVTTLIRTGHTRETLWVEMVDLEIANVPKPISDAVLQDISRTTYTREQVLDLASNSLPDHLRALLKKNRNDLDLAFEDITPRKRGDALEVDATFSIDEQAAFGLASDLVFARAAVSLQTVASFFRPDEAHAQFFDKLQELTDQIDPEQSLEEILQGIQEGKSPEEILQNTLAGLGDCRAVF